MDIVCSNILKHFDSLKFARTFLENALIDTFFVKILPSSRQLYEVINPEVTFPRTIP